MSAIQRGCEGKVVPAKDSPEPMHVSKTHQDHQPVEARQRVKDAKKRLER